MGSILVSIEARVIGIERVFYFCFVRVPGRDSDIEGKDSFILFRFIWWSSRFIVKALRSGHDDLPTHL